MSQFDALGFTSRRHELPGRPSTEYVQPQRLLRRVMAFRRRSIDDIVNDPIVKNDILGYWKVLKQIERRTQVLELEKQWNQLGQRL